jgi:hypothetical protein
LPAKALSLAALSDGIFGVAMTLLAIDLRVPARELMHHERDLRQALFAVWPEVLVYLLSFLALGIFWVSNRSSITCAVPTSASPGFTWRSCLPSLSCRFPPSFSGRTTPIAPPTRI